MKSVWHWTHLELFQFTVIWSIGDDICTDRRATFNSCDIYISSPPALTVTQLLNTRRKQSFHVVLGTPGVERSLCGLLLCRERIYLLITMRDWPIVSAASSRYIISWWRKILQRQHKQFFYENMVYIPTIPLTVANDFCPSWVCTSQHEIQLYW